MRTLVYEPYFDKPGHFSEYVMRIGAGAQRHSRQVSFLLGRAEGTQKPEIQGAEEVYTFHYAASMAKTGLNRLRWYANLKGIGSLTRLLASGRFDALHIIDSEMLILIIPLLCLRFCGRLKRDFVIIFTQHAANFGSRDERGRRLYYNALRACIMALSYTMHFRFVTHGEFTTRQVTGFFKAPRDRVYTLGYGADPCSCQWTKTAARMKLGLPQDARVLLFFGLIRQDKGLTELIKAVGSAKSSSLQLVVAGLPRDYSSEEIEAAVASAGIQERTKLFLRYVDDDEISALFSACDFLAMPYDNSNWSNSGPLNIACQYAMPVLASDAGERGEIVRTNQLGVLYEPEDYAGLVQAVDRIATLSPAEFQAYVANVITYGAQNTWERVVDRLLAAYA